MSVIPLDLELSIRADIRLILIRAEQRFGVGFTKIKTQHLSGSHEICGLELEYISSEEAAKLKKEAMRVKQLELDELLMVAT